MGDYHGFEKYYTEGNDNNLMKKEFAHLKNSFQFFPAIQINNQPFYGTWESRNFLEAVCSGYKVTPKACYDENMKERPTKESSNAIYIVLLIVGIIAVNVAIFLLCRKYIKKNAEEKLQNDKEFNNKVHLVVANYMQMKEEMQ